MSRPRFNSADLAVDLGPLDAERHATLAKRFWLDQMWNRMVGRRVIFQRTVQRGHLTDDGGEHFTVPAGATGLIVPPFLAEDGTVRLAVRLDNPPPESEPFEGEVHWHEAQAQDAEADLGWT